MDSKIVDPILKRRRAIQARLKAAFTKAKHHATTPLDQDDATTLLDNVNGMLTSFLKIQDDLVNECKTDEAVEIQIGVTQTFEDDQAACVSALKKIIRSFPPPTPSSALNSAAVPSVVRLPAIELPSFNGNFENWVSFKDLFMATVGNNASLTGAQKLQYLKSAVKGDASNLIQSFQVIDVNYEQAWVILKDRYDVKKDIVNSIFKRLLNQSNLQKESVTGLQGLVDTTIECLRSLEVQGMPVQHWQEILAFIIGERLDPESRRQWTLTQTGTDPPKLNDMLEFLKLHLRGLMSSSTGGRHQQSSSKAGVSSQRQISTHHSSTTDKCIICKGNHNIYVCAKFKSLTAIERNSAAQANKLCFRCLKTGHSKRDCTSNHKCKTCSGPHSSFLHQEKSQSSKSANQSERSAFSSSTSESNEDSQVLLSTALVNVVDQVGEKRVVRVFIDGGSQATLITEQCAKALGLDRQKCNVKISGVSSCPVAEVRTKVNLTLHSRHSSDKMDIQAFVLPKVTGKMPSFPCNQSWEHLEGLELADPEYFRPRKIDILLGADNNQTLIKNGIKKGLGLAPVAVNTIFGWTLSGKIELQSQQHISIHHVETENILRRFWELEEFPDKKHLTEEEKKCEEIFIQTHTRQADGRYVVSLPLKSNIRKLGSSRESAVRRFHSVEKRLTAKPEIQIQYVDFMNEYQQLNHMERVKSEDSASTPIYFLPHHFVLKEDSSTTKLRVVFDGSSKSSSGVSLNDCLMVGPTVQDDLFSILLRFRCNLVALKADIGKMYRQFNVNGAHSDLQRILWRKSPDLPLEEYRLTTLTYGTASAAYLATRCLNQLAIDEKRNFPAASDILLRDAYVDDIMTGARNSCEAFQLFKELCDLLKSGGMDLRKWSCSDTEVLQRIPPELRENQEALSFDSDTTVKALGVKWSPKEDNFIFSVNIQSENNVVTKRSLLSDLAKVFDPLGWLSPTTIQAKIIFQDLWKNKMDWDERLDEETLQKWISYRNGLANIELIAIPRCLHAGNIISQQLHGFCDASEKAYAAAIYLRTVQADGSIIVRLVTAKTKVAPIKVISIPRLELCGALMVSKLMLSVKKAMKMDCEVIAWTDSTTVLKWLYSHPGRWKTFVANRVSEIQEAVPVEYWHHVRSEDNPADCASRGLPANELKEFSLWWAGPNWLKTENFPIYTQDLNLELIQSEEKRKILKVQYRMLQSSIISRFSSLVKLQRVTAYMFRYIHNLKANSKSSQMKKQTGIISCDEMRISLYYWIRVAQQEVYGKELENLKSKTNIKANSKILQLNPFVDESGMLRVGGRLHNSSLSENQKHQLILPPHHKITKLIIYFHHYDKCHAGLQLLWSTIQQEYWIPKARDVIRQEIRKCLVCRRHRAKMAEQLMGSLPSPRVNPGHPFQKSGVDFAGPFQTKLMKVTKAVHIEAAGDLTADSFIAAFKRFSSRRGVPTDLYSDCGTNFVGADKELRDMLTQSKASFGDFHAQRGTKWHFNSPASPHHGGIWEAAIKSTKYHLRRVIGATALTFEEFATILAQIEAQLNSRPLCPMSSDPFDFTALTPGHFLIGHPITAVPEPDLTHLKLNRLSRWQLTQQICQHFWRRWTAEYLTSLQQRHKWKAATRNFEIGDLVLLRDENAPPAKWKLGRVILLHPGSDGLIRIVTIKTNDGELKRPIVKLCLLLPTEEQ